MLPVHLVGIDVSAQRLCVALGTASGSIAHLEFPNTPTGHRNLVRRLTKKRRAARVVLEATGLYSLGVALALHKAPRLEVMIANPSATSSFAKACLQRSKTDAVDAELLLEFGRRMEFRPWRPPAPERLQLRTLARRITALVAMNIQEKNRLHALQDLSPIVRNDIEVNLRHLQRRIERLETQALDLIRQADDLHTAYTTILSVPGIGTRTGLQILAELAVLPADMTARQWVAHGGLDPRHQVSGSSVHKPARISKAGNRYLRMALYMPALVAVQRVPEVRAFYDRLLDRGKKPLQAVVAVMRKLLHALHGMLRTLQPFDPKRFCGVPLKNA